MMLVAMAVAEAKVVGKPDYWILLVSMKFPAVVAVGVAAELDLVVAVGTELELEKTLKSLAGVVAVVSYEVLAFFVVESELAKEG